MIKKTNKTKKAQQVNKKRTVKLKKINKQCRKTFLIKKYQKKPNETWTSTRHGVLTKFTRCIEKVIQTREIHIKIEKKH